MNRAFSNNQFERQNNFMATVETSRLVDDSHRTTELKRAEFLDVRSLVTNFIFNLGGEFVVILLGAVCIPYVLQRLGTDSFGVLSLVWVVLAYMSLFDLGLSRAITKFAAEAIGKGEHGVLPRLLGTSLTVQLGMGLFGGSLLFLLSPWIAERLLKIPEPLISESVKSFKVLAIAVPVVLLTNCLRGMLEALQRFDLINYVKVPVNASMFLSPLLLLPFGGRLPSIILLMAAFRFAAMLAYLRFCLLSLPEPGLRIGFESKVLQPLLRYGGWITVSNITGPVLIYLDRFMIGILVSIGAVAYYTAPADMINRALILPASLCAILFPAFSSLSGAGEKGKLEEIYARSVKYLIIMLGPVLLIVAAFARDILQAWLGPVFAEQSTLPLQILTLGIFVNSVGFFPYSLLQGLGKPNLTGAFHLVEIPIHFVVVWALVNRMGIVGAAIASTLRVLIDAVLLFWACSWLRLTSLRILRAHRMVQSCLIMLVLGAAVWLSAASGLTRWEKVTLSAASIVCYLVALWHWSFDARDREFLHTTIRQIPKQLFRKEHSRGVITPSVEL